VKILVTGSAGHLGEALVRRQKAAGHEVVSLDINSSPHTSAVGSITDAAFVARHMTGVRVVYHAATLHKPHVATHGKSDFVATNVQGTLNLLEAAVAEGVEAFVYTSTTSLFGHAMRPPETEPAQWVTEDLRPIPRNIYGVTKSAAEDLCHLFHRRHDLNCIALRTSRFFPEDDDDRARRDLYDPENCKVNELLFRRVELADVVSAHEVAAARAGDLGFGVFIITATTPFRPEDVAQLRNDAPTVLRRRVPEFEAVYHARGWRMFEGIDRVYDNTAARTVLGWEPDYDFRRALCNLESGEELWSALALEVGVKGYHDEVFEDGPFPVEPDRG